MDFNDTQEEAAFRAEAAAWLKANVPTPDELAGLDDIAASKLWRPHPHHERHTRATAGRTRHNAGTTRRADAMPAVPGRAGRAA